MVSISLCMIVKNEEDVLARCLKSAAELKGQNEEESHTLDIRAVAVEHEGFLYRSSQGLWPHPR